MIASNKCFRAQEKTRRVLQLIDLMASFRVPKSIADLLDYIEASPQMSKYGCKKTLQRDLALLCDMGLVIESGRVPGRFRGVQPMGYKLDLGRSERLQTVAIEMDSLN